MTQHLEQRHAGLDVSVEDRALLAEIVAAAERAATFIREQDATRGTLVWDIKGESDFVSAVDRGAESLIRDLLAPPGRDVTFVGEESAPDTLAGKGVTFVVDPLDGTTNYLHTYPAYAVSIGALINGAPVAGVVIDIPRNECFTAVRNGGTCRDGVPVRVSAITDPSLALLATGVPFRKPEQIARYLAHLPKVLEFTSGVRRSGSAAIDLASVACGRVEGFWEVRLAPWDVAAGILLVREAGGVVTDFSGGPSVPAFASYVAGNPAMHAWLLSTLQ
jgi:myo-inositol-1(or 4)-monophosphatase